MSVPKRIQRKRTKGWRMPEGAVYVGRPSDWGNPWHILPLSRFGPFDVVDEYGDFFGQSTGLEGARAMAVRLFLCSLRADDGLRAQIRCELAGRDLACWCPLDQPCHADVLLELANR